MAEILLKHLLRTKGLSFNAEIDSAATSTEEIGNGIHFGTKQILKKNKIPFENHIAKRLTVQDCEEYDYIIGMDKNNINNIIRLAGNGYEYKIYSLLSFTGTHRDVLDPWYTGDFETTYQDISCGISALANYLIEEGKI